MSPHPKSGRIIALIAAVQFVYILDFMMLMPLGPDLAKALGFGAHHLGWLSGAYTLASALSGLVAARFLDRFDRKPALLIAFAGVGIATVAAVFAHNLPGLMAARVLTGIAGGPAVAVGLAIVVDVTSPEHRGRALGQVMISFSMAAIAGVPFALELARLAGWTAPFWVTGGLALVVWLLAAWLLPSLTGHVGRHQPVSPMTLLAKPAVRDAYLASGATMFSAFLVIPNFSAYFQFNLDFPRAGLGSLYFAGGLTALVVMQVAGRMADRIGSQRVVGIASVFFIAATLMTFAPWHTLPLMLLFVAFMSSQSARNVGLGAATSKVPEPHERAGFMSMQTTVQHLSTSAAAFVSSAALTESPDGALLGMTQIALLSAASALLTPWALARLSRRRSTMAVVAS